MSNLSAEQSERHDKGTSDEARLQDPNIPHRVEEWTDEEDGEDEMRESQPVRAVGQPWMPRVTFAETIPDGQDPSVKAVAGIRRRDSLKTAQFDDLLKLELERECGDAAQNQGEHEKPEHPAKLSEIFGCARFSESSHDADLVLIHTLCGSIPRRSFSRRNVRRLEFHCKTVVKSGDDTGASHFPAGEIGRAPCRGR